MRIGFDGKRAVCNMTGLGNYSRLTIEEVAKKFLRLSKMENKQADTPAEKEIEFGMYTSRPHQTVKENQLLIYTPEMRKNKRLDSLKSMENVEFRFPPAAGFKGSLWRTFGITNSLRADKVDIYHGLSNELPLNIKNSGVKSVVTIHDLIYRRLPACYSKIDRMLYDYKYGKSCHNADRIIAISECTKKDIIEIYGIDEEKIDVVYQGCDDIFRRNYQSAQLEETIQRLQLPSKYLLQVGTIEWRKNLELSIRALSAIEDGIELVVIGRNRRGYKERMQKIAAETGVASRIHWLENVDFSDLPKIYAGAEASLYPSRYEGFGIPVIEAIESGTPVVAAKGSCLEEAGGPGGIYVDAGNPRQMAEAIQSLINNPNLRSAKIEEGKKYVKRFDNSHMANSIIEVYRRIINQQVSLLVY